MNKIFLSILILCSFSIADSCSSKYNCTKKPNSKYKYKFDYHCTLPSKNATMPITAKDVFESDGKTLKKYWGTGENVCNVLGWMNDGAEKFTKVNGLHSLHSSRDCERTPLTAP